MLLGTLQALLGPTSTISSQSYGYIIWLQFRVVCDSFHDDNSFHTSVLLDVRWFDLGPSYRWSDVVFDGSVS